MKSMLDRARKVADIELDGRHNYKKYAKHVDFFYLDRCNYYVSIYDYERLCEEYSAKHASPYA